MLEVIFRGIAGILFAVVVWALLTPVVFIMATPVVLLLVLCRSKGTFWDNLWDEYRRLWRVSIDLGTYMLPPW